MTENYIKNILFIGIGGQGIILASDILTEAAFLSGFDVKKSEIHGMSQRGGSVCSDVRYGTKIYSPIIPDGKVDILVALEPDEIERYKNHLAPNAKIIQADEKLKAELPHPKTLNIAMLGMISRELDNDINKENWLKAMSNKIKEKMIDVNTKAFELGRKLM